MQCERAAEASKAKYGGRPIAKKYREGNVKRLRAEVKSESTGEQAEDSDPY